MRIFDDGEKNPIERLKAEFEPKGIKVFPISAVTGQGLKELLYHVNQGTSGQCSGREPYRI